MSRDNSHSRIKKYLTRRILSFLSYTASRYAQDVRCTTNVPFSVQRILARETLRSPVASLWLVALPFVTFAPCTVWALHHQSGGAFKLPRHLHDRGRLPLSLGTHRIGGDFGSPMNPYLPILPGWIRAYVSLLDDLMGSFRAAPWPIEEATSIPRYTEQPDSTLLPKDE